MRTALQRNGWLIAQPIAHRGLFDSAAGRPENSMPAFEYAVRVGIPFEFDVQLTRDGQPIVAHDADLARVAGVSLLVSDADWSRMRHLRLEEGAHRIPTLEDVLTLVDGNVPIVVDIRRWRSSPAELERAVVQRLRDYDGPAALQSFDPMAVMRLRRLAPDRPVGQISGALRSAKRIVAALARPMYTNVLTRPDYISYELSELPSAAVSFWQKLGKPVVAWSVHSSADEERAIQLADNFYFSGYLPRNYERV